MSGGLKDFFSDAFQEEHALSKIAAESIIVLEIPQFNIAHEKFVVLITSSLNGDEICAACINTNPSPRGNHIVIRPNTYTFLNHDSHIDCGSLVSFRKDYLKSLLKQEPNRYKGNLESSDYIDVLMKLRNSETIPAEQIEKFNL